MSLFESIGETLTGFSKSLEALPRVAIEHIHDVERGPDILGDSVRIQFGPNSQGQTTSDEQLRESSEQVKSANASEQNMAHLDQVRDRVSAAYGQIEQTSSSASLDIHNQQSNFETNNWLEAA